MGDDAFVFHFSLFRLGIYLQRRLNVPVCANCGENSGCRYSAVSRLSVVGVWEQSWDTSHM